MSSVRRRVGHKTDFESAISICLLAILGLIGVGIFLKQFDVDMSRFGLEVHREEMNLRSLVPVGFETLSEIETYDSENLYEKINGRAPFYIKSGFQKLFTQQFMSKDDENLDCRQTSLSMELSVYDMATVRNAFSVYSVQRRAEAEVWPDVQFGYKTSNALFLAHGKYYIELIGSAESDELLKAMAEVGRKIRSELAVDKMTEIAELRFFPTENIVPGSFRLYLADAFGFEGCQNTFAAQYQINAHHITAFLSRKDSQQDAKKAAKSYCNFLVDNGGVEKTVPHQLAVRLSRPGPALTGSIGAAGKFTAKMIDFDGITEIVFAIGPFFAGIHEAENQQAAEKLAAVLINKLSEVTKEMSND